MTDKQTCENWRRGLEYTYAHRLVVYIHTALLHLLSALNNVLILSVRCSTNLLIHMYHYNKIMKIVTNNESYSTDEI